MVHRLSRPARPESAIGTSPMSATLRFQCECGEREILSVSAVFDSNTDEDRFIWTMRMLWRDVKFEAEQHIKGAAA